ncbi:hypothetical protein KR032_011826, partial [Drosophila birchii]
MSEKHGQLGAQWTKSAAPAAQASATIPVQVPIPLPIPVPVPVPLQKANPNPYVNCNLQPTDITYNAARFQAPVIHAKASPLTITPVGSGGAVPAGSQISPTSHTHVPVPVATPSGFVPPPFPNAGTGATSVLTPNPFVAAAGNAAAGLAFANAFSFNTAQQLGLGKIMHVVGGTPPAGSVPATTAPPVAAATPSVPAIAGQRHSNEAGPAASGVINSTIAENVMNALTNSMSATTGGASVPSEEKMRRVQQVIESSLDDTAKLQISQILERVSVLKPIEKLFLYLRLPGECADTDPLRQPQNPLGTRSEINHTINWVRSHLEHDAQVSIPKQDVYNDYIAYCERLSIKPLSTADFGKVMKQVFPGVRPRRLGTRGNSRYCYAAMRKTTKLPPPQLPQLNKIDKGLGDDPSADSKLLAASPNMVGLLPTAGGGDSECWDVVRGWAEKLLNTKLESVADLSSRIRSNNATVSTKKYAAREPKDKRVLTDIGPLKKRRKKKRKGSTSSESSCNQLATGQDAGSSQDASDEQLLKIKQEIIDSPIHHQHQQQQQAPLAYLQQVTPMNLATDQRSSSAVRNLTPKIMEMGTPSVVLSQQDEPSPTGLVIKDEVEDYTSNIFCKKVLKAQQTKGFWANSPSSGTTGGGGGLLVPPTITTTSATPPPPNSGISPVPGPGLSMGPPSQMMIVNSVSPSSSMDATPKVASRNQMMILRAKRLMAAENAALAAAAEDSGLPENLGLPRERVISICNMDKHELDDYFLPGEDEENSEEPDNELLQYFQMGDAEEKQLNSLDAAEPNRNPQEPTSMGSAPEAMPAPGRGAAAVVAAAAAMLTPVPAPSMLPGQAGVGSASASLALMSKKHQQQQEKQQHHLQQQQLQRPRQLSSIINNNKRKISLSNATASNGSNKNHFLPISPNINGSNGTGASASTPASVPASANSSQNCFASPGVTRMKQRSSLLSKQQSLDCDNRDPMIGAHRKGRGYVYSYPTSTSASAPPSPSLLQQWMGPSWSFSSGGNTCSFTDSSQSADPLVNQNSMDLETSLALTGANDLDSSEMQRSQSVPLSQLQRRCSQQSPSLNFYSENSNSQQSAPLKDTGLLYEDVDVSSLISPSFNHKFNSMTQQTATTCSSSAGSSSGYSSGGSAGIVSRSVPSTPLPHQQQSSLISMNGSGMTANGAGAGAGGSGSGNGAGCGVENGFFNISPSFNWGKASSGNGNHLAYASHSFGARNPLDISKSMPTTPIANQCFRYSPSEMRRDFLINGNTIDSLPSSSAYGAGMATDPGLALSTDTLIDDSAPSSADVV